MLKATGAAVDAPAILRAPNDDPAISGVPQPRGCCSLPNNGCDQHKADSETWSAETASIHVDFTKAAACRPGGPATIRVRVQTRNARFVRVMRGQLSLAFMGAPLTIEYASLGMADSLILMVMALVVFGPRRLPQIGRQIGKLMYEFRKASNDFKFQMEEELRNAEEADRRKKEEERQRALAAQRSTELASVLAEPSEPVNAIESPYPGEGTYPPPTPPESPAALPAPEDQTPRILPPTTGEIVPAERPARVVGPSEDSTGDTTELGVSPGGKGEAAAEYSQPAANQQKDATAEALNQHG
jgi:sec-independent protein translocase protein TatB